VPTPSFNLCSALLLLTGVSACLSAQPPSSVWDTYHDYAALTRELKGLQRAHPDLIQLTSLGHSVQGRDIWLLAIGPQNGNRQSPAVLFDGAMHGSEVIGSECLLSYARYLAERYRSDPAVYRLVQRTQIDLIPMVNPDGVEAGKTARSWKEARKNAHGVNLNRNFDWNWDEAGAEDPAKEDYRGPQAFSEPESQVIRDFLQTRAVMIYLNCHAGENREPHIVTPLHSKDGTRYEAISEAIEREAGCTRARGALAGGAFNWAYWVGMDRLRRIEARPLALALEIYSDPEITPVSRNWWGRYNPSGAEFSEYLGKVQKVLIELTQQAHAGTE